MGGGGGGGGRDSSIFRGGSPARDIKRRPSPRVR